MSESIIKKIYKADVNEFPTLSDYLESLCFEHGVPMKETQQILLCIEEEFVNIAHYAYPDGNGEVEMSFDFSVEKELTVTFIDTGIEFNPLAKEDPDVTLSIDERKIGGLGIFLCKKLMNKFTYERINNSNVIKMTKNY